MLINVINHRGQKCHMIDEGGISLRGDMTEMKYSLGILTFEKSKLLSDAFKFIYCGHSWVCQHYVDCLKKR